MSNDKTLELRIKIATQEALASVSSLKGELASFAEQAAKLTGSESLAGVLKQTREAAERAAVSFNLFGGSSGELRQTQLELKNACIDLVRNGIDPQSDEIKNLIEEYKKLEKAAGDIDEANGSNIDSFGKLKNSIMSIAEVAAAAKALMFIKDIGAFALQTADNFQTMRNQFGILLGDMEAGAGLFNEIKAFNDVTPFDLDTLTQATNVLIAAKVPLQDLQSQLTKFGDLAQGNSQRLTSYIHAFSQAAAKGKADMMVLNQYLNQGVPILDALAKNFGVTTAEIVEMSGNGQISFADFSAALDDLTAAGGRYFGGMELASKSLTAMQEGLKEATNSLAASYGDILLPAANSVLGTLTKLTNAINEDPIFKGLFAAAIASASVYLAAMAVKAGIAFAAQMKLNLAIGVLNPAVLAATGAVAIMTATYVSTAAAIDKMAKGTDSHTASLRWQRNAIDDNRAAIENYRLSLQGLNLEEIIIKMGEAQRAVDQQRAESARRGAVVFRSNEIDQLNTAIEQFKNMRTAFINTFDDGKKAEIQNRINVAQTYMVTVEITQDERNALENIIKAARDELAVLEGDIHRKAAQWKKDWAEIYGQFKADQKDDPFHIIDLEREKKHAEAIANYVSERQTEIHDQINEYYEARRQEVISRLAEEEGRIQRELTSSRLDDIRYEMEKAIEAIDILEARRIFAAGESEEEIADIRKRFAELRGDTRVKFALEIDRVSYEEALEAVWSLAGEEERLRRELSKTRTDDIAYELSEALRAIDILEARRVLATGESEEEIAAIRKRFAELRDDTEHEFRIKIDTAALAEARESVKSWQQELSDSLLQSLLDIGSYSEQAAVIIADLSSQLIQLSASAALSGFEDFGRALGEGEEAMESLSQALANMARQILKQLPMMFLQAGLQLIASNQWPMGLAFIAAAGSSAIISGFVSGASSNASAKVSNHARGGVFDEYARTARAYAAGGAFTNQIVSAPAYFAHGGGFGLMGEAGPEAIMPLTRMPNGNLGVQTAGANVTINIINNTGAEVRGEKTENADGSARWEITIGELINRHITSGKADRAMSRYGSRPTGV